MYTKWTGVLLHKLPLNFVLKKYLYVEFLHCVIKADVRLKSTLNLCMLKQNKGEIVFKIRASQSSVSTVLIYLHQKNTIKINLIHKTLILNEYFKQ
jgi:hypothetical protein